MVDLSFLLPVWNGLVTFLPLISTVALALGAIGGIPEIRRSLDPRSLLKVSVGQVTRTAQPMGYSVQVTVLNQKKRLRRTMDAVNVVSSAYILDRNHQQFLGIHNFNISPYLMEGSQITKDMPFGFSFVTGESYTVIVLVACQGLTHYIRENISYTG
jgi:hypothetical protein